eukprot:5343459-Pyramimonas_sp.AAC.1
MGQACAASAAALQSPDLCARTSLRQRANFSANEKAEVLNMSALARLPATVISNLISSSFSAGSALKSRPSARFPKSFAKEWRMNAQGGSAPRGADSTAGARGAQGRDRRGEIGEVSCCVTGRA